MLSKKTINKLRSFQKISEHYINIDDNAFINKQMSRLDFIPIQYEINKNSQTLTEIFIKVLFDNKINFFYIIYNFNFINLKKTNFKVSEHNTNLSNKNLKKYFKKDYFNGKLIYLYNINFKNRKITINCFKNYYSLRASNKYISLAVQAYIVIDSYNYIIGKRKNVITEKNFLEFVPSGGL